MSCSESAVAYNCKETNHYFLINIAESISDMGYVDMTWVGHKGAHHPTSLADLRHATLLCSLLPPLRWC